MGIFAKRETKQLVSDRLVLDAVAIRELEGLMPELSAQQRHSLLVLASMLSVNTPELPASWPAPGKRIEASSLNHPSMSWRNGGPVTFAWAEGKPDQRDWTMQFVLADQGAFRRVQSYTTRGDVLSSKKLFTSLAFNWENSLTSSRVPLVAHPGPPSTDLVAQAAFPFADSLSPYWEDCHFVVPADLGAGMSVSLPAGAVPLVCDSLRQLGLVCALDQRLPLDWAGLTEASLQLAAGPNSDVLTVDPGPAPGPARLLRLFNVVTWLFTQLRSDPSLPADTRQAIGSVLDRLIAGWDDPHLRRLEERIWTQERRGPVLPFQGDAPVPVAMTIQTKEGDLTALFALAQAPLMRVEQWWSSSLRRKNRHKEMTRYTTMSRPAGFNEETEVSAAEYSRGNAAPPGALGRAEDTNERHWSCSLERATPAPGGFVHVVALDGLRRVGPYLSHAHEYLRLLVTLAQLVQEHDSTAQIRTLSIQQ